MVKHTQAIRRQQQTNCLSVFDHFVKLVLEGLSYILCKNRFQIFGIGIFESFCKVLIDRVNTVYWISEAKCSKLLTSKFGHIKVFRKWF